MSLTFLPAPLQNLVQQGYLEREFKEALQIKMAYRLGAQQIPIPTGVGTTYTQTRMGRKAPVTTPLNPQARVTTNTNGVTPSTGGNEQWTFSIDEYADGIPLNLMDQETTIKRLFLENAKICGEQGSQSIEWLIRQGIEDCYLQGDTYVLGGTAATYAHLNDVRGFQNVMVNGKLVPISNTNTLTVYATGSLKQTLTIVNCQVDAENVSDAAAVGGISGVVTFSNATAPVAGDRFLSASASQIVRSNAKATTAQLGGGDILKVQNILDAAKNLNKNGVPKYPDNTYHCPIDYDGIVQLQNDQRFITAWMGAYGSKEIQDGMVFRYGGVTFIPTTEAMIQSPGGMVSQNIHRAYVMGYNAVYQGNFAGMKNSINAVAGQNGYAEMVGDLAMVVKAGGDTLLENIIQSWKWVGGINCATDNTTNPNNMPSASNALFKRIAAIEYVG